ncbi:MAG: GNAT family N-acetyltransferase [Defluviitaleaceae bacterium]|nr:GNAT family N-acetyltransferase [Defluviitaleaceae bacterium]
MIIPVTNDNQMEWAKMCNALWQENTVEQMLAELPNLPNEFLCYAEGKPAGLVSLTLRHDYVEGTETSPVGYLEAIYVKPEFRGQGIARKLVEFCKQWSADQGCTEFASDCELHNEASRLFHNAVGFTEANRIICFTMKL